MIQVYCNDENGVNKFLAENHGKIKFISSQMCLNGDFEYIMITYQKLED